MALTRYAMVQNGVVHNVIEDDHLTPGWTACPDNVGPGFTFDGTNWAPPAPPAPLPDVAGFTAGIKTALGGIVQLNALYTKYPLFLNAMQTAEWADVAALIEAAKAAGDVTATQYTAFQAAATANNIPIVLP